MPYVLMDDGWTIPDELVDDFEARAVGQGLLKTVFTQDTLRGPGDFRRRIQLPGTIAVFVHDGRQIAAAAWMTGIMRNFAEAHFMPLREARGEFARRGGRLVLEYFYSFEVGGKPMLDVLLGYVPTVNQAAINFVQELGFVKVGEIPKLDRGKGSVTLLYHLRT